MYQAVLGIIRSINIQLPAIAESIKLETEGIQTKSIIYLLEDFFRETNLDYESLDLLLVFCLGKGKIRLCIDRKEWDFGKCQVNILRVTACICARQVKFLYFFGILGEEKVVTITFLLWIINIGLPVLVGSFLLLKNIKSKNE